MHDDNKNDNESVAFSAPALEGPLSAEPKPFAPDQMIRCDECLRANAPTRVNCLYCGTALPFNETLGNLQKPALRPLEKWEQGYNNIILPSSANSPRTAPQMDSPPPPNLPESDLTEAADLLKLTREDLALILSHGLPLPLARASTSDEALLVQRRLNRLRMDTIIVPDADLGVTEMPPVKVRAIAIEPAGFIAYPTPETQGINVSWLSLAVAVVGRLVIKRVELREQKTTRADDRILDANQFFADEGVLEFYTLEQKTPYRIAANSFDFSCLGRGKSFVAGQNLLSVLEMFCDRAPQLLRDDSYHAVRKALEVVWPSQRQNEAGGWRRDRPGKYSIGSATEISNEEQFSRYSRLRYYLTFGSRERNDDDA